MNKNGQIVLIDDDEDDLKLLIEIFADLNLPNEVHLFKNPSSAIAFLELEDTNPFLIISDINMPKMNGFQFRDALLANEKIRNQKVPFLFFTTANTLKVVTNANDLYIQGVFQKPAKAGEWNKTLKTIVTYWQLSMPQDQYQL